MQTRLQGDELVGFYRDRDGKQDKKGHDGGVMHWEFGSYNIKWESGVLGHECLFFLMLSFFLSTRCFPRSLLNTQYHMLALLGFRKITYLKVGDIYVLLQGKFF